MKYIFGNRWSDMVRMMCRNTKPKNACENGDDTTTYSTDEKLSELEALDLTAEKMAREIRSKQSVEMRCPDDRAGLCFVGHVCSHRGLHERSCGCENNCYTGSTSCVPVDEVPYVYYYGVDLAYTEPKKPTIEEVRKSSRALEVDILTLIRKFEKDNNIYVLNIKTFDSWGNPRDEDNILIYKTADVKVGLDV